MYILLQTYDLLTIMHYGFVGLCSYMQAKYPGYLIAPLRINGSAVESVFSSLKFIAGGHLASTNYSSTLATLITQRQTCINPNSEKGYRK